MPPRRASAARRSSGSGYSSMKVALRFRPSGIRGLYAPSSSSIRVGFEDAFDSKHFLDLVVHRQPVLEVERGMRSDGKLSRALVREHPCPEGGSLRGIGLEGEQVGTRETVHVGASSCSDYMP